MINEVHIFDLEEMMHFWDKLPSNARVISLIDPELKNPPYPIETERIKVFRFDDIEEYHLTDEMRERYKRAGMISPDEGVFMTDEDADRIVDFVMDMMEGLERIPVYVHCHGGFARSPAVAQFIAQVAGISKNEIKRYDKPWSPNQWVAGKLEEAYRRRIMP